MTVTSVITVDITQAMRNELAALRVSEAQAWALAAELKRVLEMVEWVAPSISTGYCPWCEAWIQQGHKPDCPRQAVLFPPEVQG